MAGPFPDLSENRRQAVVFKFLRQDITVVIVDAFMWYSDALAKTGSLVLFTISPGKV